MRRTSITGAAFDRVCFFIAAGLYGLGRILMALSEGAMRASAFFHRGPWDSFAERTLAEYDEGAR